MERTRPALSWSRSAGRRARTPRRRAPGRAAAPRGRWPRGRSRGRAAGHGDRTRGRARPAACRGSAPRRARPAGADRRPRPWAGRLVRAAEPRLDLVLPVVGELPALRGEELDAVVVEGVVRRREYHAAGRPQAPASAPRPRASAGPPPRAHRPGREDAGDQRLLEERTREPRVAPDQDGGSRPAPGPRSAKCAAATRPSRYANSGVSGSRFAMPPDPVGPEETAQPCTAPLTAAPPA